jgi:hypothetical protein
VTHKVSRTCSHPEWDTFLRNLSWSKLTSWTTHPPRQSPRKNFQQNPLLCQRYRQLPVLTLNIWWARNLINILRYVTEYLFLNNYLQIWRYAWHIYRIFNRTNFDFCSNCHFGILEARAKSTVYYYFVVAEVYKYFVFATSPSVEYLATFRT